MNIEKPELVNELAIVLSDTVVLSYRALGAHWNVMGPDFHEYHAFFEKIYEDLDGSIDAVAEDIRKLGAPAPAGLNDFVALARVSSTPDSDYSCAALASSLHAGIEEALISIDNAFQLANAMNEQGIADFLAGRDDMLKKWRWQLAASLYGN